MYLGLLAASDHRASILHLSQILIGVFGVEDSDYLAFLVGYIGTVHEL